VQIRFCVFIAANSLLRFHSCKIAFAFSRLQNRFCGLADYLLDGYDHDQDDAVWLTTFRRIDPSTVAV
jgi:hypothetical protein